MELKMEEGLEKYKAILKTERENYQKELAEVQERYPLVRLALAMQQATIAELSTPSSSTGSVLDALVSIDPATAQKIAIEKSEALRDLKACLGRSQSYTDGLDCFDTFSKRWTGQDDREPV